MASEEKDTRPIYERNMEAAIRQADEGLRRPRPKAKPDPVAELEAHSDGGVSILHERVDNSRDKFMQVPIDDVAPNPYQYRETFDGLDELAESIRKNGIIMIPIGRPTPVGSKGKPYQLGAGERRLRAAKIAGLKTLPLLVRPMSDDEMIEVLFQENLNRKDVSPLEEAAGFKAALDRGYSVEQLMQKTGRSRGYVYGRVKLLELAARPMRALAAGELPAAHAELIARLADRDAQDRCTKEVLGLVDNDSRDALAAVGIEHEGISKVVGPDYPARDPQLLSYRATKELIRRRYMTRLAAAKFDPEDASLLPSAGVCTTCLHRAGNQPELPGLVTGKGDDHCTKPSCFEAKTKAAFRRAANEACARGVRIFDHPSDTGRVFGANATQVASDSPYVDAGDKMPADLARAGATQSWAKALGKRAADVPKVLVQDGTGAARELLDREKAVEVLRELGKIDKPTKPPGKGGDKPAKSATKKKDEKEARAQELKEEAFKRVLGQIADGAFPDPKNAAAELALWKWMAFAVTSTGTSNSEAWEMVAERRGLKLKQGERWIEWESLQKAIRDMKSVREVRSLVIELMVATLDIFEAGAHGTTGAADQAFKSALKLFGADWSKAMDAAKAAAKAEAQVEAAKKAPKPVCGAASRYSKEAVCAREPGHAGEHRSAKVASGRVIAWKIDEDGESGQVFPVNAKGTLLAQTGGWAYPAEKKTAPKPVARAMDGKDCGAMSPKGWPCQDDVDHQGSHWNGDERWWDKRPSRKKGGR